MILDSSAVIAAIRGEEESPRVIKAIGAADLVAIGAPSIAECSIALVRKFGVVGRLMLARFLEQNQVVTIPFDDRHGEAAADAFIRYGKSRHPARLNFGDCMTYAIAKVADEPLLFVGDDFAKTDVAVA